jgi:hypothetical protein
VACCIRWTWKERLQPHPRLLCNWGGRVAVVALSASTYSALPLSEEGNRLGTVVDLAAVTRKPTGKTVYWQQVDLDRQTSFGNTPKPCPSLFFAIGRVDHQILVLTVRHQLMETLSHTPPTFSPAAEPLIQKSKHDCLSFGSRFPLSKSIRRRNPILAFWE